MGEETVEDKKLPFQMEMMVEITKVSGGVSALLSVVNTMSRKIDRLEEQLRHLKSSILESE